MGAVTILRALSGWATKRWYRDCKGNVKKTAYANLKYFAFESVDVGSVRDLGAVLVRLEREPAALVVRGEPIDGIDRRRARRLLHADPDGSPATIRAEARQWLMVDLDHVACPAGTDATEDPEAAVEYLIGLLPPEFWDSTCWWQFSSSQGFAGDTLSAHLWFWLDRPIPDDDLRRWAVDFNRGRGKLIDPAVFNPVQVHYTAAPIFDGVPDPLPRRSGLRPGLEDAVALVLPQPGAPALYGAANDAGGVAPIGFSGFLDHIGTEAGFRQPIVSAIASYIATNGVDGTDAVALKEAVRSAVLSADPGARSAGDIQRYASDGYLDDAIRWVVDRERAKRAAEAEDVAPEAAEGGGDARAAQTQARKLIECPPAFQSQPRSPEAASGELKAVLVDFFDNALAHRIALRDKQRAMEDATAAVLAEAGVDSLEDVFDEEQCHKLKAEIKRRRRRASKAVMRRHGIRAWKKAPRLSVQGAAGLGKTSLMAKEIARRPELWRLHVDIMLPRIELAEETAGKVREAIFRRTPGKMFFGGPLVWTMRGRSQLDPETGKPMCARAPLAEKTARLGKSLYATLCRQFDPLTGTSTECSHAPHCAYLQQYRQREPAIRCYSQEHLALPRTLNLPCGDFLIVDENCLRADPRSQDS